MIGEKEIENEIASLVVLKTITRAYAEIASVRMKRARDTVLLTRQFMDDIHEIFRHVLASYKKQVAVIAKKRGFKRGGQITFLAHNGRTVAVFLSSNAGLYGDIVPDTFDEFLKEVREKGSEATIVGRYGRSLFLAAEPKMPYTYFDLPDYAIKTEEIEKIIKHLVAYEEIHVYYGQFKNIISQEPSMLKISAEEYISGVGEERISYLFEPSLEAILRFFEVEIFMSLFSQTVRESQLAKFASRMLSMDEAEQNIDELLGKRRFEKLKLSHKLSNKKQLASLTSIMASFN